MRRRCAGGRSGVPPNSASSRDSLRDSSSGRVPLPGAAEGGGVISPHADPRALLCKSLAFRGGAAARSLRVGILGRSEASC